MNQPLALLNQLTPSEFLDQYWQKKPLLIKAAIPDFEGLLSPEELAGLACEEDVQSRIVEYKKGVWHAQHGPFTEDDFAALPDAPTAEHNWTLLVQSVNHFLPEASALLQQFSFIPHARLDDLMVSYAPHGGGVGPHFDSYDVFLLQGQGKRLWRISEQSDLSLVEGAPLRILKNFDTKQEWLLEAGDMLYLPPRYAHDGIAQGECMTYSVGFRVPQTGDLARELLVRLSEGAEDAAGCDLYKDATQPAVSKPAAMPEGLADFAKSALQKALKDPKALQRALGEYLTEPKANVWFEIGDTPDRLKSVHLDRRSKMMYDAHHIFLNGESWRAAGKDAALMRQLADSRELGQVELAKASPEALGLLMEWCDDGWLHPGA